MPDYKYISTSGICKLQLVQNPFEKKLAAEPEAQAGGGSVFQGICASSHLVDLVLEMAAQWEADLILLYRRSPNPRVHLIFMGLEA